jgi:hypothetical protein
MKAKDSERVHCYFVDEAGDLSLFNKCRSIKQKPSNRLGLTGQAGQTPGMEPTFICSRVTFIIPEIQSNIKNYCHNRLIA